MYAKIQTFDGNVIVSGKIVDQKTSINGTININLITFDYKWFFKTNGTKNYSVITTNNFISFKSFDKNYYSFLKYDKWKNAYNTYLDDIDVYEEYTYDEIDIEIKQLCDTLNLIPNIKTIGSCCGHNVQQAFVNIKFMSLDSILYILKILSHKIFRHNFVLTSDKTLIPSANSEYPEFKLKTIKIGKDAYKDIDRLTEFLKYN